MPDAHATGHPRRVPTRDAETPEIRARRRALHTARAVTLGLALGAAAAGCEATTNAWCDVFTDTRYCCDRSPGRTWNTTTNRCDVALPVVGPIVAPDRSPRDATERA